MSSSTVFDEWAANEASVIQKLAENKSMRTVRVIDDIFQPNGSKYWVVNYELKTWEKPNDFSCIDLFNKAGVNTYKEALQTNYLASNNINPSDVTSIITVNKDIKETENFYGNYIVNYGFLFIIMAITISATYPATDTTAGEKERGTFETLLTFPIKSRDIIVGKFLSVSLSSIITGVVSLILMLISLVYANGSFEIYKDTNLMLSTSSLIFSILVIIAYSLLVSGLCIAIASKSKTFKEAQSALTPLTFICFFPGMIAFMAGVSSSPLLSLVPFLNFTLLFQDIVVGNIDIVNILLMSLSTIVIITLVLVVIIKQYKSEKVLF